MRRTVTTKLQFFAVLPSGDVSAGFNIHIDRLKLLMHTDFHWRVDQDL